MHLQKAVYNAFEQLCSSLEQLTPMEYSMPCKTLHGNTIGQHVRHIIELFECLEKGYDIGVVNYEKRRRDPLIEADAILAARLLRSIHDRLVRDNKSLVLEATYDPLSADTVTISTNYDREVAYNLEHTIHHMALIRVGLEEASRVRVPEEFGVASSTLKHRRQCAQ